MNDGDWLSRAVWAGIFATPFQIAMVVTGHWVAAVAQRFGLVGTLISLAAGVGYALGGGLGAGTGFVGGALAGGGCALLGIALSFALGDVTAAVLVFGTLASGVAGGLGGLVTAAVR